MGRVYEGLLELEPGVTNEPMCRLRRAKLEVVVPLSQGARDRKLPAANVDDTNGDAQNDSEGKRNGKTKLQFIEEIPAHRFYLRVGLGRKASGSFYTPQAFVRFLVRETLGPQLAERSPKDNPNPLAILGLKILDPAMGSGHFLVEACRYLGQALYEACRLCDERASECERQAEAAKSNEVRQRLIAQGLLFRKRVATPSDPNRELLAYLPSRNRGADETLRSQRKALALCRRLVAMHCLYGVDKNPLAVELARVALWLESNAEGHPLDFTGNHLVGGDSLTGPNFEHLLTLPRSGKPNYDTHLPDIESRLRKRLVLALKRAHSLDESLAPIRLLAAAWAGGVMLGGRGDDSAYSDLVLAVARGHDGLAVVRARPKLREMVALGRDSVAYELQFPEVFCLDGSHETRGGFDAILGNPPWDAIKFNTREFLAAFDLRVLEAPTRKERDRVESALMASPKVAELFAAYQERFEQVKRSNDRVST